MKFEQLNLDAQKKYNLIMKELNVPTTTRARKQELAQQYQELMGHSMGELSQAAREHIEEHKEERKEWQSKRWSKREATHPK